MAQPLKTFTATDSTGKVYTRTAARDFDYCTVYVGFSAYAQWSSRKNSAETNARAMRNLALKEGCLVYGRAVEVLLTKIAP